MATDEIYESYTGGEDEYVVQEGDTVQSVAEKFLDDPAAYPLILAWNGIFESQFQPGLKIYFPRNSY